MIKAFTDTRSFEWKAYANDKHGAMNALRMAWREHKRQYSECNWVEWMPESEFIEDISYMEIPNATVSKRVAYRDREIIWEQK